MNSGLRKLLVVVCLVLIILGEWIMWEAVVKPLKNMNPASWSRDFPSPFYIFYAPLWFWHDLSIAIVVVCSAVLAYLALVTPQICSGEASGLRLHCSQNADR
jgi:hypothetical protein